MRQIQNRILSGRSDGFLFIRILCFLLSVLFLVTTLPGDGNAATVYANSSTLSEPSYISDSAHPQYFQPTDSQIQDAQLDLCYSAISENAGLILQCISLLLILLLVVVLVRKKESEE